MPLLPPCRHHYNRVEDEKQLAGASALLGARGHLNDPVLLTTKLSRCGLFTGPSIYRAIYGAIYL